MTNTAITCSSAPFSQLLLMMSWQLMARRMKIRGHLLQVVCRVELCCGVLHYFVLCGRMKIRGHHYTRAAGLSAKKGMRGVWCLVESVPLDMMMLQIRTSTPIFSPQPLICWEIQTRFSNAWRLLVLVAIMIYIWCGLLCTDLSTRNQKRRHQTNAKVAAEN